MPDHQISHSLVQTLRSIPSFSTLEEQTLLTIVGESISLVWKSGSRIFEQGMPGDALYVILSGEVSIHDGDSLEGRVVADLKAGDFFGEMSLLLNATHSKTATTLMDSEILVLPKEAFVTLLDSNPMLRAHFDEVLKNRGKWIESPAPI